MACVTGSSGGQDEVTVGVWIRARPLITREVLQGAKACIRVDSDEESCSVLVGQNRQFTFDHAFGASSSQAQVYQSCVAPLVESCFDGFNATVLAYGQTGSGKTYTMGTGECVDEEQLGVAPRVIRHMFEGIRQRSKRAHWSVRAQFLEIYNEEVFDLIHPEIPSRAILIRDTGDGMVIVSGASETPVECAEELMGLLQQGLAARATGSTHVNEQSSRSHAILTITLEQRRAQSASADSTGSSTSGGGGGGPLSTGEVRSAKLHLVDLAGSERTKKVRASLQGARFRETVNINQGLLALGNVISALGDERRRGSHVPYRESKLTRLLQDSLGGNSRTAMVACVSAADLSMEETLNTLKYANRARNIRNKPIINRALPDTLSPLRGAVHEAQLEVLKRLVEQLPPSSGFVRSLPLDELMQLDMADGAACLEVLNKIKDALADCGSAPHERGGGGGSDIGIRQQGSPSELDTWLKDQGISVGQLLADCGRAITGMLKGMAELEAHGQIDRHAREHIMSSLDSSTIKLLPTVRALGRLCSGPGTGAGPANTDSNRTSSSNTATKDNITLEARTSGSSSSAREQQLEQRIEALEAQLRSSQAARRAAEDDLARDEVIFADKMRELQDAQQTALTAQQQLKEADERHAKEVANLQQQLDTMKARPRMLGLLQHLQRRTAGQGPASQGGTSEEEGSRRSSRSNRPSDGGAVRSNGAGDEAADVDGLQADAESDEVIYDEDLLSYISETDYTEQHRVQLENDVALREELAAVLRQKAAAEAERAALEREALAQRGSFDAARSLMERQLMALSQSIMQHQSQVEALQAAGQEARDRAQQYQERISALEQGIQEREAALASLHDELQAVAGSAQRSAEERAALMRQYEERIAAATAQMATMRRQLQHQEGAAQRGRGQSDGRVAALEAELARMRHEQAELRKALNERIAAFERDSQQRAKEVAVLRKAAEAAKKRLQELEQENMAQRLLLRQKQQEVQAAQQRARDFRRNSAVGPTSAASASSQQGVSAPSSPFAVSRQGTPGQPAAAAAAAAAGGPKASASGGAGSRSASPGPRKPSSTAAAGVRFAQQQDKAGNAGPCDGAAGSTSGCAAAPVTLTAPQRDWLERIAAAAGQRDEASTKLELLTARRVELLERREALIREQSQMQLRTSRRSEHLVRLIAEAEQELERYMACQAADALADSEANGAPAHPLSDGAVKLQQCIADVAQRKEQLEEKLRSGRLLEDREQEELDDVDDLLDALDTELSYIDQEMQSRKEALEKADKMYSALYQQSVAMTLPQLRAALSYALQSMGSNSARVQRLEGALATIEAGAARREAALSESLASMSMRLAASVQSSRGSSFTAPHSSSGLPSSDGAPNSQPSAQAGPPSGQYLHPLHQPHGRRSGDSSSAEPGGGGGGGVPESASAAPAAPAPKRPNPHQALAPGHGHGAAPSPATTRVLGQVAAAAAAINAAAAAAASKSSSVGRAGNSSSAVAVGVPPRNTPPQQQQQHNSSSSEAGVLRCASMESAGSSASTSSVSSSRRVTWATTPPQLGGASTPQSPRRPAAAPATGILRSFDPWQQSQGHGLQLLQEELFEEELLEGELLQGELYLQEQQQESSSLGRNRALAAAAAVEPLSRQAAGPGLPATVAAHASSGGHASGSAPRQQVDTLTTSRAHPTASSQPGTLTAQGPSRRGHANGCDYAYEAEPAVHVHVTPSLSDALLPYKQHIKRQPQVQAQADGNVRGSAGSSATPSRHKAFVP